MWNNVGPLLPIAIPGFAAVAVILFAGFVRSRALMVTLALASLLAAALCTVGWREPQSLFGDMLRIGPYARLSALMCIGIGAFACCAAPEYIRRMRLEYGAEYFALVLSAVAGMVVMVAANDLMVLFVNFELLSLSVYI
ncbi:MAG: hypothetical protein PHC61_16825, partial [Chitinivibrionales bacterium]|nr:hypothetical protein [Chitinivibrionales bacterium]